MRMVEADEAVVERRLRAGEYPCPSCRGELRPWGHGEERPLGRGGATVRIRPRRSRCKGCRVTHILLPVLALLRRCDPAQVIGEALGLKVAGWGYRRIAASSGIPPSTVGDRGRRFGANAEAIRATFSSLAHRIDASLGAIEPAGGPVADALQAIVIAADAAARAFGPAPLWAFASGASAGRLLANTNPSLPVAYRPRK